MKVIWLYSVRAYLRVGMFFYFKKIEVHHVENIPKDKPVLLLSNHQNALLDALLIAIFSKRFAYFLTRAAVFKNRFVSDILKSFQMLPIYRIRDGWTNLNNNNAIFETCSELLSQNQVIAIFPEGNHNLERRVRPLSKGFTRIILDAYDKYPEMDLQLVPVGLNFKNAVHFPDETAIYFGKAISAKDFINDNKNESVANIKFKIQSEISQLTTNIPLENYANIEDKLDGLNVNYLKPKDVNQCLTNDFKNCPKSHKKHFLFLSRISKLLLNLYLIIPYLIWKLSIQPKIKEPEFISTFRFVVAITIVPVYLITVMFIISKVYNIESALIFLFSALLLTLIAVKIPNRLKFIKKK